MKTKGGKTSLESLRAKYMFISMFGRLGVALAFKKYHSCKKVEDHI
jgi:hypothetical protein